MPKESSTNPIPFVLAAIVIAYVSIVLVKKPQKATPGSETLSAFVPSASADTAPDDAPDAAPSTEAEAEARHVAHSEGTARVVLVSLDGMHAALVDEMPNMKELFKEGSHTLKNRVPTAATTAVSHAALFTGTDPEVNGVTTEPRKDEAIGNDPRVHGVAFRWKPLLVEETIFTAVEKTGRGVLGYVEKGKLVGLLRADGTEKGIISKNSIDKAALHDCNAFKDASVGLIVLHFKMIDGAGHEVGWLTPEQYKEAKIIDAKLGQVRTCITEADARDGLSTTLIVTADHGGTPGLKKGHSANDDDNRLVPWVAVGPGIKRDYEIEGRTDLPPIKRPRNGKTSVAATMLLYDTVPTVLRILNMAPDSIPNLSPHAKSVDEIFVTD
ncbi:MAG: alkaline phosphatase [Patescibacteria group bacterium]|jgi:hypothetical protein